jgi:heptosyltransferase I
VKILILKPSSLGDVVQALPVLRLLKAWRKDTEVHWWISSDLECLLEGDPDLAGTIRFDRRQWAQPKAWKGLFHSVCEIRARQFDWVIDLQGLARSGLMAWLAKGRLTVGVEDWREGAPGLYDVVVRRPSPLTHAVDWYLEVLRKLDVPVHDRFDWLPLRVKVAAGLRQRWTPAGARWVVLSPGARWVNKRWPVESYRDLVRHLSRETTDVRFALLGGKADATLTAEIASAAPNPCLDLAGRTALPEMVEWIRLSTAVVTNDTGPMHVAAALKKPLVAIFGPTEPRRTGPYGQLEHALQLPLPCAPCLKARCTHSPTLECLRGISPAVVAAKVRGILNTAR